MKLIVNLPDDVTTLEASAPFPTRAANEVRRRFRDTHPLDVPGYNIKATTFERFFSQVRAADHNGRQKAIGLRPGRAGSTSRLDMAIETIIYDLPNKNPTVLEGSKFFGTLASNFRVPHFTSSDRQDMDNAVKEKDVTGTEIILVEVNALQKFCNVSFDTLSIEYGISTSGRLTVLLSRYNNGTIVTTPGSNAEIGLYLDEHDLIP